MKRLIIYLSLVVYGIGIGFAQSPSVSSMIKAFVPRSNAKPIAAMLDAAGYSYQFESPGYDQYMEYILSKNCKVIHQEDWSNINYHPSPKTAHSSIVQLTVLGEFVTYMSVRVYSKAAFLNWVSQLKALGYKTTSSDSGNRGRSWEYAAKGKPSITIWNDYSDTYALSMSK